jgi:hypothetical protein
MKQVLEQPSEEICLDIAHKRVRTRETYTEM